MPAYESAAVKYSKKIAAVGQVGADPDEPPAAKPKKGEFSMNFLRKIAENSGKIIVYNELICTAAPPKKKAAPAVKKVTEKLEGFTISEPTFGPPK